MLWQRQEAGLASGFTFNDNASCQAHGIAAKNEKLFATSGMRVLSIVAFAVFFATASLNYFRTIRSDVPSFPFRQFRNDKTNARI